MVLLEASAWQEHSLTQASLQDLTSGCQQKNSVLPQPQLGYRGKFILAAASSLEGLLLQQTRNSRPVTSYLKPCSARHWPHKAPEGFKLFPNVMALVQTQKWYSIFVFLYLSPELLHGKLPI